MGKRALSIEPYDRLANIIGLCLQDLGHEFDLATDARISGDRLSEVAYDRILTNVDQNRNEWRLRGLRLGGHACDPGIPVVMIADHKTDAASAAAKGCTVIRKPFMPEKLATAIAHAPAAAWWSGF
jgi:DNA-binding NtrC family response regulator